MYLYICVDVERGNICTVVDWRVVSFGFFGLFSSCIYKCSIWYTAETEGRCPSCSLFSCLNGLMRGFSGAMMAEINTTARFLVWLIANCFNTLYVFCSYISSFTFVLPVCLEEQVFQRGLAHLDKASGRVSRPKLKVSDEISMWVYPAWLLSSIVQVSPPELTEELMSSTSRAWFIHLNTDTQDRVHFQIKISNFKDVSH